MQPICVHIVGAGPGDPELLTVKAVRVLEQAEIVVYDRLVSPEILDHVPAAATRLYVGKMAGCHPMPQDQINALLVELAQTGKRVVRLKGGDPLIFGRGSEETLHLARHGIPFDVVPGITAASGCAAAFGIPLTHRGLATGVRYVTGHSRDGTLDLDWHSLADPNTTLVVYMGLANLPLISARLIGAGLSADTPAAAVAEGTTPRQRIVPATLGTIAQELLERDLPSPVLVFIGSVVALIGACMPARPAAIREARHAPPKLALV
ncbi:MAG: uroporphyrinogen-III C-methyltransferase [Alphaproteobacteria bacterium]|nr:uroporphyrinogen-III C-methyltransferase [Alphaproteobacteria bacterium]